MELLVSVRNEAEARITANYPVDRLDLKEPLLGSLGATTPQVWRTVVPAWHGQVRVSIALGELVDLPDVRDIPPQTDSVKVGLAGCSGLPDWHGRLSDLYDRLPETVSRVAVFYADHEMAGCPSYSQILAAAEQLSCETVLVDTHTKSAGSVFQYLGEQDLKSMRNAAHQIGCRFTLAGSLRQAHLPALERIRPDVVAVRGAVCGGGREDEISDSALARFVASFRGTCEPSGPAFNTDPR